MRRLAAVLAVALLPAAGWAADGAEFFEKSVRPVLADHCYPCHPAQGKKAKGGLTDVAGEVIRPILA